MKPDNPPPAAGANEEVIRLIDTLHQSGRRLEDLTAGEVDAVTDRDGSTLLLRRSQDQLRHGEAAKQAAILNSLPAHIALLDVHGVIISANAAWTRFPCEGVAHGAGHALGLNYLDICDGARGKHAACAHQIGEGVRAVLGGGVDSFSLEYSCGPPENRYWFQLTVTPLGSDPPHGVVLMHLDITEQKRHQESLRQSKERLQVSESRFRQMAENIRDVFFLIEAETNRMLYISPAYEEIWGRSCESLYMDPASWAEAIHPEDRASIDEKFRTGMAAGSFEYEHRIIRPDGSLRWIEARGFPVRDAAGRIIGVAGIAADINERKIAEDAILREKDFTAAMLDSLPGLFYVIDEQGRFLRWNRNFEVVSGNASTEIAALAPTHFFAEADKERIAAAMARVFSSGHATEEADFLAKDHTRTPHLFTGKLVQIEQRPCIIGMGVDISARKQAEQELRESERRFRQLAENIDDVFFLQNLDSSKMYYVSPAYETVWGRTCESLYANPASWRDSIHAEDRERVFTSFNEGRNTGFDHEFRIVRPDGALRWVHVRGFPILDDAGHPYRIAGVATDVTEQKRDEIKIKRLNRVYAVLSGINTLIVRVRSREELFTEACRIAVEDGRFKMAWIGVVDPEAMKILPVAFAGEGDPEFLTVIKNISLREGEPGGHTMTARGIREKKAIIANEIRNDPRVMFAKERAERGIFSMAVLPLLVADEAVGVIALYAGDPGFFDAEEMKLLEELAGDIAFALENVGRREKLAQLARTRAVFGEINAAIVRIHDSDELFKEACRIAVEAGQFKLAWIGIANRDTLKIDVAASAGGGQEYVSLVRSIADAMSSKGIGLASKAIQTGKYVVCNDITTDVEVLAYPKQALARGFRAAIALPLFRAGGAIGALHLYAGEPNFFNAQEIAVLNELAGNISLAIDHIDKQARLDYLGYYDELTGLANRSLFLERVAQYIRSAASGGHQVAVYLLDLERFRNINDSLGRPAGDALLKQVAEWLTQSVGDAGLLARVGADHFAVVLPNVKQGSDVAWQIERSREAFLNHAFRLNDAVFRIAAKVGVALFPGDGTDADTLFRNAEAALKKAKASGERYLLYNQTMTDAVAGRLTLENQLRQALEHEEFVLHYQPKVNLKTSEVTGAEALIRWNDPRTGLVPPGHFIPVLEETGLIYEVGRWALRKAMEDYLRWRASGLPVVRIAVNVSPLQLRNRGFIDEIERTISIDAGAAAGLELEITESLIMEDVTHSIASLQAIQAMGVSIAIDDFGTGFSSLSYLAKLPVDTLKIDRSFVIDMTLSPEGLALVSTIVNLAHALGLKVVAEGVETEEQSHLLQLLNCDETQGYLFSKPVPGEIFEAKFLVLSDLAKRNKSVLAATGPHPVIHG
jgi:diguanylate cyclase (GGDEF)-like protein/PAS domain S-box-containing protein